MKSTVSSTANVDSLPVFLFLHVLPHFCIYFWISSFLANVEFNVLVANSSHFAMSRILLCFLYYFQLVVQSSHLLLWLSHGQKKTNHTRKHWTTRNEVKFGNDATNKDTELRATCKAWLQYCVAKFIVQSEGNANNKYFASVFFFKRSMREMLRQDRDLQTISVVKR
jgi:hypothetical protein